MRKRIHEFLRFCVVGFIGYLVDAGLLEVFVDQGFAPGIARLGSIAVALQCTYLLHGAFTYRDHKGYSRRGWLTFLSTNGIGAAINYGTFMLMLHLLSLPDPQLTRQLALLAGTVAALFFNHWANRKFVFKGGA